MMPEFLVNKDMFGRYCRIPTGTGGDMHIYKIVSRIDSNGYCDVPLTSTSEKTLHNQIVPVLLVIHCGIDESKVRRVALSDCEIVPADVAEVKHGEWIDLHDENVLYEQTYKCSACGEWFVIEAGTPKENGYKYCPNCGARMDGEGDERNDLFCYEN